MKNLEKGSDLWENGELISLNIELRAIKDIPSGSEIYVSNYFEGPMKKELIKPEIIQYIEQLFDTTISSFSEENLQAFNETNISMILHSLLDPFLETYIINTPDLSPLAIQYMKNIRDMKIEYLKRSPKVHHLIQGLMIYSQIVGQDYNVLLQHIENSILEFYQILPNKKLAPIRNQENKTFLNKITLAIAETGLSDEDKITNKTASKDIAEKLKSFIKYGKFSRMEIIITYYVIVQKHVFDENFISDIKLIIEKFNKSGEGSLPNITDESWGI